MDYSIGEREGLEINHLLAAAVKVYKHVGTIGKIIIPCNRGDYVTVTLRKSRSPERNSKDEEWRKFADRCDREVVFIKATQKNNGTTW